MKNTAAVITVSDKGYAGQRQDTSGPALCAMLRAAGWEIVHTAMVPDEAEQIQAELIRCSDELGISLVLTTGGTGFSPRDITPEATRDVIQREAPGIPEAMRAESMKITPRGCLSRAFAGIRGGTLIVNLPGSEKAAKENLLAVQDALGHGVEMLRSVGSADCAAPPVSAAKKEAPSMDIWLREAKADASAESCGMYLFHSGVVRKTAKAQVRQNIVSAPVSSILFSYDAAKVDAAMERARELEGIYYVRAWLNEGTLQVGDDIMRVLVGGDIRPHVESALETLVGELKTNCVNETEVQ